MEKHAVFGLTLVATITCIATGMPWWVAALTLACSVGAYAWACHGYQQHIDNLIKSAPQWLEESANRPLVRSMDVSSEACAEIRSTLDSLTGSIRQATAELTTSFAGLGDKTSQINRKISEVLLVVTGSKERAGIDDGHDVVTVETFAGEVSEILAQYVELLIDVSEKSVQAVHHIGDMVNELEQMFSLPCMEYHKLVDEEANRPRKC